MKLVIEQKQDRSLDAVIQYSEEDDYNNQLVKLAFLNSVRSLLDKEITEINTYVSFWQTSRIVDKRVE